MFNLGSFPLLVIPVIMYNVMAFAFGTVPDAEAPETTPPAVEEIITEGQPEGLGDPVDAPASEDIAPPAETAQAPNPNAADVFNAVRIEVGLPTGGQWQITAGDILLAFAMALLFLELVKATSSKTGAIVNHGLSLVLFIVCLVEFLLIPAFATSVFFLIMLMTLLDTLAGFTVTIVTARRDIAVGEGFGE